MLYKCITFIVSAAYSADGMVTTKMLRGEKPHGSGPDNGGPLATFTNVVTGVATLVSDGVTAIAEKVADFRMSQSDHLEEALLNLQEAQKEIKLGIDHLETLASDSNKNGMIDPKENLNNAKKRLKSVIGAVGNRGVTGNEKVKISVENVQNAVDEAIKKLGDVNASETAREKGVESESPRSSGAAEVVQSLAIMKDVPAQLASVTAKVQGFPGQAKVCEAIEEAKTQIENITTKVPDAESEITKVAGRMNDFIVGVKQGAGNDKFIDRQTASVDMVAAMYVLKEKLDHLEAPKNNNEGHQENKPEKEKNAAEARDLVKAAEKEIDHVSKPMKIFVTKNNETKPIELEVYPIDLVRDVKRKINGEKEIPPDQQVLRFGGDALTDGKTLAECKIEKDSQLVYESHEVGVVPPTGF